METKFKNFLLERKFFNKLFKINPLKEIVLEFLEREDITTEDIIKGVDKYREYDIYLALRKILLENGIESIFREGISYDYASMTSEKNHFWLECGKWVIDIFSLFNRNCGESTNIDIFYDNTDEVLYKGENPIYEF